jgi:hypothetical protein
MPSMDAPDWRAFWRGDTRRFDALLTQLNRQRGRESGLY